VWGGGVFLRGLPANNTPISPLFGAEVLLRRLGSSFQ
jgi:hypothetical protein